jgi:hypothetical protein
MSDEQILEELTRTKDLCDQVGALFGRVASQGRMLSLHETELADELSSLLLMQIRKLPKGLRTKIQSPPLQLKAGETLDTVCLTLRQIASPPTRSKPKEWVVAPNAKIHCAY